MVGRWFSDAGKKGKKAKTFLSPEGKKASFNSACPTGACNDKSSSISRVFLWSLGRWQVRYFDEPCWCTPGKHASRRQVIHGHCRYCRFCGQRRLLLARLAAWKPCSVFVHDQLGHSLVVIMMNVVLRMELMVLARASPT